MNRRIVHFLHTQLVERWNSEGIPRDELRWTLEDGRTVRTYRKLNCCMLCRRIGVNEAALCHACWALVDDEEFRIGTQWLTGERS